MRVLIVFVWLVLVMWFLPILFLSPAGFLSPWTTGFFLRCLKPFFLSGLRGCHFVVFAWNRRGFRCRERGFDFDQAASFFGGLCRFHDRAAGPGCGGVEFACDQP